MARRHFKYEWTPERFAQLVEIWRENISMTLIARQMGVVSRSAIGSAVRRGRELGYHLPARLSDKAAIIAKERVATVKPDPTPPIPEPIDVPEDGIPMELLQPYSCRFPVTADSPFLFCGQERCDSGPYCYHHRARSLSNAKARDAA